MAIENEPPVPAYVGWPTFRNYVERLKGSAIPSVVDSTVMPGLSGGTQSQLKGALRFLGYLNNDDQVTEKFRALISAYETDGWVPLLAKHLPSAYKEVIGTLDLGTATMAQLKARFREGGATGSTLEKAVRFFLQGMKEAGLPYSPHLDLRGAITSGRPKASRPSKAAGVRDGGERQRVPDGSPLPEGEAIRLRLPNVGEAVLYLPPGTTEEAWGMVDAYVRAYLKLERKK